VKLRYTLQALADLDAILEHIDEKSPQGAMRVKRREKFIVDRPDQVSVTMSQSTGGCEFR
jgi:plasmid stabilization system protein ParE